MLRPHHNSLNLATKKYSFGWSGKAMMLFTHDRAIMTILILTMPNFNKKFIIKTDAPKSS